MFEIIRHLHISLNRLLVVNRLCMNLRQERDLRGLVNQFSNEKIFDLCDKGGQKFYIGFDPSADSLQLGNMFSVMAAVHLMRYGNKCYFLVGGATGMI